jgi:hypothetical protein
MSNIQGRKDGAGRGGRQNVQCPIYNFQRKKQPNVHVGMSMEKKMVRQGKRLLTGRRSVSILVLILK